MSMVGKCEHCGKAFRYKLIHNGFNESAYAYCERCGVTAILDGWKVPVEASLTIHKAITPDIEPLLAPCPCGGSFKAGASPRCPLCGSEISATEATEWIEGNAPGSEMGWRWQENWTGLYAIVIEGRIVSDNWQT